MLKMMAWYYGNLESLKKIALFDSRMGDKADWSDFFLKHLINICKGEIEAGNRPLGLFTSTGWKNLASKFE
jgi:hypothetical protein